MKGRILVEDEEEQDKMSLLKSQRSLLSEKSKCEKVNKIRGEERKQDKATVSKSGKFCPYRSHIVRQRLHWLAQFDLRGTYRKSSMLSSLPPVHHKRTLHGRDDNQQQAPRRE